jgi:hypothetical protein
MQRRVLTLFHASDIIKDKQKMTTEITIAVQLALAARCRICVGSGGQADPAIVSIKPRRVCSPQPTDGLHRNEKWTTKRKMERRLQGTTDRAPTSNGRG